MVTDAFPWNGEIQTALKNIFKLTSFRPQQLKCCNAIMSKHDVLLIAPTGGGKSLCYQLPVYKQPPQLLTRTVNFYTFYITGCCKSRHNCSGLAITITHGRSGLVYEKTRC